MTKTKKKPATGAPLLETQLQSTLAVDEAAGVIRGVKVLGYESANGRSYAPGAVSRAKNLYENKSVFLNHPGRPNEERKIQDKIGRLRNVHEKSDGLYADLEYLKAHPQASVIVEAAQRMPDQLGLSHNAEGRIKSEGGKTIVEELTRVRSVDLVSDPATVRGLFESEGYAMDGEMEGGAMAPVDSVKAGIRQAIIAIIDGEGDVATMAAQIKDLLKAQEQAMNKLSGGSSSSDGAASEDSTESGSEETMAQESKTGNAGKPDPTVVALQEQINRMEAESKCRDLLEQAGIKSDAVKLKALAAMPDEASQKALLESWKPVGGGSTGSGQSQTPRSSVLPSRSSLLEGRRESEENQIPKDSKSFAALVR